MTAAQKTFIEVQKRQSTLRGEFNTLRAVETRSADQDTRLTALDGELTASETEFRTAADGLLTEQTTVTAPAARIPKHASGGSCASRRTSGTCTTQFSRSAARRTGQPPKRKRRTGALRIRSA